MLPPACPRPLAPPPGCGAPRSGSREAKLPGPAPRGAFALAASAGRGREPAVGLPHGILRREWGRQISGCRSFEQPRGWRREPFAAFAPHGPPSGLRAPPVCRAVLGICPGAALHAPRSPRRRGALGRSCPAAAGVRGALARTGKKRAVFAFANKRELFPGEEAGRAAPGLPFPPPPSSAFAQLPRALASCGGLGAGTGNRGAGPRGVAGGGGRRWGECCRARRLQSPSLQPWSCRTHEQQVAEDSESSAPTCRALGPGGAAREPPCRSGRRCARAVPFVYTLEDTQLRKHRRSRAE